MRRRWLISLVCVVAVGLLAAASLPWWLPLAARMAASRYGATFGAYERIGYARFALHAVQVRRPGVVVQVDRVEADTPLLWAWRHLRGNDGPTVAGTWSVAVERVSPAPSPPPSGWLLLRAKLLHLTGTLDRWLPDVAVGPGVVRWPNGEIRVKAAQWRQRSLHAEALQFRALTANATVAFVPSADRISATATDPQQGARFDLQSRGAVVSGTAAWWDQPATINATFGEQGWMPAQAEITADDVKIPGERLKLAKLYAAVAGRAHVVWQSGKVAADVGLRGQPLPDQKAPPLEVTLRARGDAQALTIEELHATIPGGAAALSAPVTIDRSGRIHETSAQFTVRYDLAQQPWTHARGILAGNAHVVPAGMQAPRVDFNLTAADVTLPGAALSRAEVDGRLTWPQLILNRIHLSGTAGEQLQAVGGWNFREKQLSDAVITGKISSATIARWLPAGLNFQVATVDARAAGPLATLDHRGRIHVTALQMGRIKPANVDLDWRGRGTEIGSFSIEAAVADTRVTASGAANSSELRLVEFTFSQKGVVALKMTQPAHIVWRPSLEVHDLHLSGTDASIDANAAWGEVGHVNVVAKGFSSMWLADFLPMRGPGWTVPSFAITGKWDRGPMAYSTAGELAFALPNDRTAVVNFSAKGGATGLSLEALHAVETGNAVVNATGQLPVTVSPGSQPLIAINATGPLALDATTVPNAAFWQQLANMTGIELRSPEVSAHLTGTWAQPRGTVAFRLAHAVMDPKRFSRPLPTVDAVDVAIAGDSDGLRLEKFSLTVEGQLVRASGKLLLSRDAWTQLARAPLPYLQRQSELRVEVPDAQVAMFSRFLPAALAPAGRLQADIRFDHGSLGGSLRLRDAASRPLGPLGVLQQVNAEVNFTERRVILRHVTATTGGQPVTVAGTVELPATGWLAGSMGQPKYDVTLRGQNLPFVRQSGLLVRGDLDLKLQTPAEGSPGISGKVVLRDSLFLTDVRAFLPHGGGASPSRRPPYFSVDTAPLNTWRLNVEVLGTRFMRLRTPVFSGVASTHFHLGGTLGEPRTIGEATIDEGLIRMPFAAFQVQQGAVRLTEESPYEPTIYLRGTGRHYGYDLTMEITGKASAPNIEFTSSPALDAEQVLLMVMTGAAPSNEINTSLTHRAVQIGAFFGQSLVTTLTGGGVQPDRLSIESGEKISEQGRETYAIEYKLNDRWSITGEYDEFDEYNAGFKWRIAPKKKER